ncbi:translocation protein SEC62-like [Convolutriloba macropyga]|uniref:translocation protein SEC62-like n=1 Tax=Convolutriloba macropyga TaxID=536237 RepID=UPI003F51D3BA
MPKAKPAKSLRPGRGKAGGNSKDGKAEKFTKEEKAVVKYLFNNVESKKASMYGNNKLYFAGSKAIACLMESKFATGSASESLFNNRKMAIEFCQKLLMKNAFHHVFKIVKKQKPRTKESSKDEASKSAKSKDKSDTSDKSKNSKKSATKSTSDLKSSENKDEKSAEAPTGAAGDLDTSSGLRKRKSKKDGSQEKSESAERKEKESTKAVAEDANNKESKGSNKSGTKVGGGEGDSQSPEGQPAKKKVKGKVLLELNPNQTFYDDPKCYYVWVYESQSIWKSLVGGGLIIGSIAICLFPLWPEWLRYSAWYATSSVAMGLLGLLFGLAIIRLMIYGIVFVFTKSKCRFWIFPNLFAEVGFFESFVPYYESKWIEPGDEKKSKNKKAKDSSDEERDDDEESLHVENDEEENEDQGQKDDIKNEEELSSDDENEGQEVEKVDSLEDEKVEQSNSSNISAEENDFEVLDAQS